MGKKNKKKKDYYDNGLSDIEMKVLNDIADTLERYQMIHDQAVIIEGVDADEYKRNVKKWKNMVKSIRKGDIDGIIDQDKLEEYIVQTYSQDFQ